MERFEVAGLESCGEKPEALRFDPLAVKRRGRKRDVVAALDEGTRERHERQEVTVADGSGEEDAHSGRSSATAVPRATRTRGETRPREQNPRRSVDGQSSVAGRDHRIGRLVESCPRTGERSIARTSDGCRPAGMERLTTETAVASGSRQAGVPIGRVPGGVTPLGTVRALPVSIALV
jgi:hypothetical protein